jgi:hypothetical protein
LSDQEELAAEFGGKVFAQRELFAENRTTRTEFLDPEDFAAAARPSLRDHPVPGGLG